MYLCLRCDLNGICKTCRYVHNKIDVRSLIRFTPILEIYHYFLMVISISEVSDYGYSLSGINALPFDIGDYPIKRFMGHLITFLNSKNKQFMKKKK